MGRYILALDQGTTGTRACLVTEDGAIHARAYQELRQYYPRAGWVEHDGEEIWRQTQTVIQQALAEAEAAPDDIAAIGITNQRETTLLWDRRTGRPLHRAIVWQCRRTAEICAELKAGGQEATFRRKTGLVLDPYFSGTKMRWLLEEVEGARDAAERGEVIFGTIDSWLIHRLSGGKHVTDYTNASRTLLLDLERLDWDEELLALLGVPRASLPEIVRSSGVAAETRGLEVLPDGVPIAGIAGDQQAALFGQVCVAAGEAKNTYGTGCFLLLNTGPELVRSERGLLTTVACDGSGGPCYALEGSVFVGGAVIQWLRDELGLLNTSAESEQVAQEVEDTEGVYVVPAFVGLGAPYWAAEARGAILGLTRGAGRAHIVRAALEAIAFQSGEIVKLMEAESGRGPEVLRADGGACHNDLLMQMQADLIQRPVERPREVESTALGAAYLAGLAVGVWRDGEQLRGLNPAGMRFEPQLDADRVREKWEGWKKAVARVLWEG